MPHILGLLLEVMEAPLYLIPDMLYGQQIWITAGRVALPNGSDGESAVVPLQCAAMHCLLKYQVWTMMVYEWQQDRGQNFITAFRF